MTLHLSIPIGAMLFFFAKPVILFISGESYLPAISILRIFSILWVIVPLHDFFNIQVLMVHHREKLLVGIYLAATVISLILNLVLIPFWFTEGAATAVVISETFVLFAAIWFSRPYFRMNAEMTREIIYCATAYPVALLAWKLTTVMEIGVLWQLLGGTIIFLAGYLFLQVVIFRNAFLLRMQLAIKGARS
jgi:O-antigen/teichoic acid export membrane protein